MSSYHINLENRFLSSPKTMKKKQLVLSFDTQIVGHVPYNLAPRMSAFFYERSEAFAEITGAGYGLEVPCVYCLYDLMFMLTK